jgi:hypothetical protein
VADIKEAPIRGLKFKGGNAQEGRFPYNAESVYLQPFPFPCIGFPDILTEDFFPPFGFPLPLPTLITSYLQCLLK